ncbi:MAG: hypothetical protein RLZZ276_2435 [Pseudomonadota bacterium]
MVTSTLADAPRGMSTATRSQFPKCETGAKATWSRRVGIAKLAPEGTQRRPSGEISMRARVLPILRGASSARRKTMASRAQPHSWVYVC